jgi:hypothetical protein
MISLLWQTDDRKPGMAVARAVRNVGRLSGEDALACAVYGSKIYNNEIFVAGSDSFHLGIQLLSPVPIDVSQRKSAVDNL